MVTASVSVRSISSDARAFILDVVVLEGDAQTRHAVTLGRDLLARLAPGQPPEEFVRRCFAFLLEREAKESILGHFDVSIIGRYFPEFETTIVASSVTGE